MDPITLVDSRIADGQKLVLQLIQDGFEVAAAFWLKAPEDAWWHLFIASRVMDRVGPGDAYRVLQTSLQQLAGTTISLVDIKLIGTANPLTTAVRKLQQQTGEQRPLHLREGQLGNLAIEEAYLYPLPVRQKHGSVALGKRRLKTAVEQVSQFDEVLAPLSPQESRAQAQLAASGISPAQADYWLRKKRREKREWPPIPAGAVVNAQVVAWWGDTPEADSNPLLLVETLDGTRGLTFKNNTEPV